MRTGTAVAGTGFGPVFSGACRTVIASATERDRAELIAAIYTLSYAAFGVPALLAGIAASHYGLRRTALVYAAAVAALAAGALVSLIVGPGAIRAVDLQPSSIPCRRLRARARSRRVCLRRPSSGPRRR